MRRLLKRRKKTMSHWIITAAIMASASLAGLYLGLFVNYRCMNRISAITFYYLNCNQKALQDIGEIRKGHIIVWNMWLDQGKVKVRVIDDKGRPVEMTYSPFFDDQVLAFIDADGHYSFELNGVNATLHCSAVICDPRDVLLSRLFAPK